MGKETKKKVFGFLERFGRILAGRAGHLLLVLFLLGVILNTFTPFKVFSVKTLFWLGLPALLLLIFHYGKEEVGGKICDTIMEIIFSFSHVLLILWALGNTFLGLIGRANPAPIHVIGMLGLALLINAFKEILYLSTVKECIVSTGYKLVDWLMSSITICIICRLLFHAKVCKFNVGLMTTLVITFLALWGFFDEKITKLLCKVFTYLASVAQRIMPWAVIFVLIGNARVKLLWVILIGVIWFALAVLSNEELRKKVLEKFGKNKKK